MEPARSEHPRIEVTKDLGKGSCNGIADQAVVADPTVPFHARIGRQQGFCHAGNDRGLGAKVRRGRLYEAARPMHAPGTVFGRYGLLDTALSIDLQPPEAGQQVADLAMDEVAAVELGRDVDGQAQLAPGRLDAPRVRCGTDKVAP